MMEPFNAILKHEPTNRRLQISSHDVSFLSSLSIIHDQGVGVVYLLAEISLQQSPPYLVNHGQILEEEQR